jgi:hypothetical protein
MFIGIDKYRFFKCRFADREIIDMRNHLLISPSNLHDLEGKVFRQGR